MFVGTAWVETHHSQQDQPQVQGHHQLPQCKTLVHTGLIQETQMLGDQSQVDLYLASASKCLSYHSNLDNFKTALIQGNQT